MRHIVNAVQFKISCEGFYIYFFQHSPFGGFIGEAFLNIYIT